MYILVTIKVFFAGGGGGKGTWGKNGEVYEEESNDPDDPNYDSETEKVNIYMTFQAKTSTQTFLPGKTFLPGYCDELLGKIFPAKRFYW